MRTTREERADLRARCRAGVIAITTDAALVAALVDDVEELDALVDAGARAVSQMAQDAAAEVDRLRGELAEARDNTDREVATLAALTLELSEARAERDARFELTAYNAGLLASLVRDCINKWDPAGSLRPLESALRAHAGKVAR